MSDLGKEQRRMTASILVKAILDWGGKGTDLAEFLGVSQTTISHWRSVGPESQRKPAVPSEEHLFKLLGVLNFRIQQNIFYLKQMMNLGAFDKKTSTLLAITAGPVFQGMEAYCSEIKEENGPGLDETFDQLKTIQKLGGPGAIRSLLDIKATWGDQQMPNVEDIEVEPMDLDAIKQSMRVGQAEIQRVEDEATAYPEFFNEKLRAKMFPKKKGKKK